MWFAKIGIFIECYKFCGDNLLYFPQKMWRTTVKHTYHPFSLGRKHEKPKGCYWLRYKKM